VTISLSRLIPFVVEGRTAHSCSSGSNGGYPVCRASLRRGVAVSRQFHHCCASSARLAHLWFRDMCGMSAMLLFSPELTTPLCGMDEGKTVQAHVRKRAWPSFQRTDVLEDKRAMCSFCRHASFIDDNITFARVCVCLRVRCVCARVHFQVRRRSLVSLRDAETTDPIVSPFDPSVDVSVKWMCKGSSILVQRKTAAPQTNQTNSTILFVCIRVYIHLCGCRVHDLCIVVCALYRRTWRKQAKRVRCL